MGALEPCLLRNAEAFHTEAPGIKGCWPGRGESGQHLDGNALQEKQLASQEH